MNCFAIMPFSEEFGDVYSVIKSTVESAFPDAKGKCFRLDESAAAGRLRERLEIAIQNTNLCIADLTGANPNVMWELGYAMALQKPVIIITQDIKTLPFDVSDMLSIQYDRTCINRTLVAKLKNSLLDTSSLMHAPNSHAGSMESDVISLMATEISQLKQMVSEVVSVWRPNASEIPQSPLNELKPLAGNWINVESNSHIYTRIIRGELVSPYCFGGNSNLTGVYFGWRRIGDYWYARYQWIKSDLSGFSFLKMESTDEMAGAWWSSEDEDVENEQPPGKAGVPAQWKRLNVVSTPRWVDEFFESAEKEGLTAYLARRKLVED